MADRMMDEITYTHKGWFGLCPAYISEPNSVEPGLEARYPYTDWLITLSVWIYSVCFRLFEVDNPMRPMRVTGELEDPIVVEYER